MSRLADELAAALRRIDCGASPTTEDGATTEWTIGNRSIEAARAALSRYDAERATDR